MTAIAGLVHEGRVYIGCDSLSSNPTYHRKDVVTNPKVFELSAPPYGSGPVLIGYTSSWRMGQLLKHKLTLPDVMHADDPMDYLIVHFVEAVRQTLKTGGYAEMENGVERGGTFLVGYGGRLFTVQGDYSVLESVDGFDACGSGGSQVKAVLHATREMKLKPEARITLALESAAAHNVTVQGPFTVKSVGPAVEAKAA